MSQSRNSSRQRLLDSAIALFAQQGMTETTTKQIAELAEVNEVTLFRQFGNKQGLLLAMLEESDLFDRLSVRLGEPVEPGASPSIALRHYAEVYLSLFAGMPELVRSLIGEAGKYPPELQQGLGQGIQRANQTLADYLAQNLAPMKVALTPEQVKLFNSALLGYAILDSTTEFHGLWRDRDAFIQSWVDGVLAGDRPADRTMQVPLDLPVSLELQAPLDLPAPLVHQIFQRAQKQGLKEFAIVYLLFGAGVSPIELVNLERFHHVSDRDAQWLQISSSADGSATFRQVPVNQWILGKRYGTYQKNPITQWLRSRKDNQTCLFLGAEEQRLTIDELQTIWQILTQDLITLAGQPPTLVQPQQTWCVEMLMRGMSLEDLQILTGQAIEQLTPYSQRAKQKAVLEQGIALDKQK